MKHLRLCFVAMMCSLGLATVLSCKEKAPEKKETAKESVDTTAVATEKASDKHSADALKARVEAIYADVTSVYNKCNEQGDGLNLKPITDAQFDKKYCSDNWNSLLEEVAAIDNANPEGEMGFFDADYWIMGQDFADLSVSDVKVKQIEGNDAMVVFNLHNSGNVTRVKLDMVFERGDWFIDDFTDNYVEDNEDDSSWKRGMIEYIDEQRQQ